MEHEAPVHAWYSASADYVLVRLGDLEGGRQANLDIRDAVYLRYQLDRAINDYEKGVG